MRKAMAAWIALFGLACAQAGARECELRLVGDLSTEWSYNRPLVPVKVNGREAMAILDSGGWHTAFFSSALEGLGLRDGATIADTFGIGGRAAFSTARLERFEFGGATWTDLRMGVIETEPGDFTNTVMIIGQNVLARFDVEFNFREDRLNLFEASGDCGERSLAYWGGDWSVTLMMRRESQFDQLFVRVRVNGQEMTAIIDSGAPLTSVFRHAAERVGVVPEELDLQEVGTTSGFGQRSFRTWVGRFDTFEIGDESIRNARLRIIDRARLNYGRNIEVILGGDFLRSHRVLAAYSQRKIYFSYLGGPVFQVMAPMLVGVENGPDDPLHDVIATCGDATGERTPEARGAACSVLIDSGRLKPRDLAPLLQWRAAAHQRAGLFDEALSDLDRLVALEPQRAEPWNSRCWLRATFRRDLQRALEDCSEALRLAPQTPHILDSRALVHLQLGQACEALADYDAAVATDAEQASFLYGRGVARRRLGQTAEGDADIKRAKELSADIEAAYASYGVAP